MKVQLISDLHFEFMKDRGESFVEGLPVVGDVLVIAGDLIPARLGLEKALGLFCNKFNKVLYIQGNHEFYGTPKSISDVEIREARAKYNNLHVLDEDVVDIGGQRFLGTTLWFRRTNVSEDMKVFWSDFNHCPDLWQWVYSKNQKALRFLEKEMQEGDVIISHHLPSLACVHERYAKEDSNCYFVCEMDDLIQERNPAYWLFGHTHESMNVTIGKSKLISNPSGYYPRMLNSNFKPDLVIEI